jgi:acyl carrier protein
MNELSSKIRQFVVSNFLFGKDTGFADGDSFLDQGIVDSTGVMELVAFVEKEFGFRVQDSELTPENLDSIAALVAFIEQKRPSGASIT